MSEPKLREQLLGHRIVPIVELGEHVRTFRPDKSEAKVGVIVVVLIMLVVLWPAWLTIENLLLPYFKFFPNGAFWAKTWGAFLLLLLIVLVECGMAYLIRYSLRLLKLRIEFYTLGLRVVSHDAERSVLWNRVYFVSITRIESRINPTNAPIDFICPKDVSINLELSVQDESSITISNSEFRSMKSIVKIVEDCATRNNITIGRIDHEL